MLLSLRQAARWAWFAVIAILALFTAYAFLHDVIDYHYDDQQNRTPLLQAILAGVSLLLALATARQTLRNARTPLQNHAGVSAGLLTLATISVMFVWEVVAILSGPL